MSKKSIFIILVISFIAGFFLRGMLGGVSIDINLGGAMKSLGFKDSQSIISKEKPVLEFVKLEIPKSVSQGDSFIMNAYFKPLRRIVGNYKMFVHLYTGSRKGWINADRNPIPAAKDWPENQITQIGPIQIYIPEDAPLGKYIIEIGLFNSEKSEDEVKFVRLPYTNIKGNHIVGSINVVKEKIVSEEAISNNLQKEAAQVFGINDYALATDTGVSKILRDVSKLDVKINNVLNISLAKNEYEAGQIIVVPIETDLKNIEIAVSDLKDKQGNVISSNNLKFNLVGYVPTRKPDYPTSFIGSWPDPLEDIRKFNVLKGEVQPIWITVYIPENVTAGDYKGLIRIKPENLKPLDVDLNVTVYDFILPTRPHLKTAFDIYTEYIAKLHNISGNDFKNMVRKYVLLLLKHKISPIYPATFPKESRDNYGALVLDFSEFDEDMDFAINNGLSAFGIGQFGGSNDNKWGDSEYVKQLFLNYTEHLKANGWIDMSYIYTYDEPNPKDAEIVKRITNLIHSVSKGLKNLVTTAPDERWGEDIDIWCPHVVNFNEAQIENEILKGKEVWWYVSSHRAGIPGFNIDISGMDNRILPWMNWKYKIGGILYWCVNRWPINPWDDAMTYSNQNGNGSLMYPGANGPVSSIRLEAIRDGIEDYEYFYILNECKEKLKTKDSTNPEIAKIENMLNIENDIIKSVSNYTQDQKRLFAKREQVAREIERVKKLLE
jgi:hypothetical protein